MTDLPLLYNGSTKDIFLYTDEKCLFKFSDRYSIFDWGEMPDHIHGKGQSTADLTEFIFKHFTDDLGCSTHLLQRGSKANELIVKRFKVPRDINIVEFYQSRPAEAFIPLEVIFRWGVPKGSSLIERGLYAEGEIFSTPLIEFTTKLENIDRLLSPQVAKELAGMNDQEFLVFIKFAEDLALSLKKLVEKNGFKLWDGKFEFAFSPGADSQQRSFTLVDSISLDELRLTYLEFPLSKEILRQIYKHTDWYNNLKLYKQNSPENFRKECPPPPALSAKTKELIANIYFYTQKALAGNNKDLEKLQQSIGELKNEHPYLG